jgi:hypothetical protein
MHARISKYANSRRNIGNNRVYSKAGMLTAAGTWATVGQQKQDTNRGRNIINSGMGATEQCWDFYTIFGG